MINVSLIAILVFSIVSCGKKDEKTPQTITTELEGKFTKACGTDDAADAESKTYSTEMLTFQGNTGTVSQNTFSDSGCTVKLLSIDQKVTFTIGEAVALPAGAKALDITPTETVLTIYDENYVKLFNAEGAAEGEKTCGGGWVSGQAKKLTNALCKGSGSFEKVEDKAYAVFKLDGKSLFLGQTDNTPETDGSSASKRAKTLESRPSVKS